MANNAMVAKRWTLLGLSISVLGFAMGGLTQSALADEDTDHPHKKVRVELREFSVSPHHKKVKAGWITFNAWNTGTRNHELVIIKTDQAAVNLPRAIEPNEEEDGASVRVPEDEVGIIDEIEAFPPGSHERKQVLLRPGHYALICNLPDHYMMGMHADFEVVP